MARGKVEGGAPPAEAELAAESTPAADEELQHGGEDGAAQKVRLKALFERLKIARIVVVDDAIESVLDGALIERALSEAPEAIEAATPFFPKVDLTANNAARFEQIEAALSGLSAEVREELGAALGKHHRGAADLGVGESMRGLIPAEMEILFLTPTHWAQQRDALLGATTDDVRTLFLFDQELNADLATQGFAKGSDIIGELSRTQTAAFGTKWFCGILSHTLQPGAEIATWRELGRTEGLELQFFMPIAKRSLDEAEAFYGAVHQTLINTYTERMKVIARTAFKEALEGALDTFANLEPLDFEHMIVKSSEVEGVSELETLIRLHSLIYRDEVKTRVLNDQTLDKFLADAATVKGVADHERSLPAASFKRLSKLRQQELYESANLVNDFLDPLRNGDLFAFQKGAGALKVWVLIAQPCDLAVRSDGKRARKDYFKLAVLAPVKTRPLGTAQEADDGLMFELEHFDHDGAQEAWVKFAEATPVDLRVLDLAATNRTGKCEIDALNPPPAGLRFSSASLANRLGVLHAFFAEKGGKIEGAREKFGDEAASLLADALVPPVSPDPSFAKFGSYDAGKFVYHIRRHGRVREPEATALLGAFTRYLSRNAREHDFSKMLAD